MSAIVAGIAVGASALGKGIYGAVQNHKASEIEKSNIRPTEAVDPIYQQNVNTAAQMAQQGIPQASYNNQVNSINQNQASGISALNNSANPGANLASVIRAGNSANSNLNAQDAAARNKNTLALIQQRGILAGAKQNAWNYNYADKYSEGLANSQALRGAGSQNIAGGLGELGQAGMGLLGAGTFSGSPKSGNGNGYGSPIGAGYRGDMNLTGQYNNAV